VLALALAVSACTGGEEPEPEIGPLPTVDGPGDVILPLDAYFLSSEEYRAYQLAGWILIGECLERFGATYTLAREDLLAGLPVFEHNGPRRYGIFDADHAAQYGYHLSPEEAPPAADPDRRWNPSETELFLVRGATSEFSGRTLPLDSNGEPLPPGGCSEEADRILTGGVPRPANSNLGNELSLESFRLMENDSRVQQVVGAWSDCMRESGYDYSSHWAANDAGWGDSATVTEEEIAVATADVACKKQVRLIETCLAVETAYQERLIEQNAEALEGIRTYFRVQAANAAEIVGRS
jgi:hypothetical protein